MTKTEQANKALVIEDFDMLFDRPDYAAAQHLWSPHYIEHSAHIVPGRDGLFELIKTMPPDLHYEHQLIVAEGDYVILHRRFSGIGQPTNWVVTDILCVADGQLAEHWDLNQDAATRAESTSRVPRFGDAIPLEATSRAKTRRQRFRPPTPNSLNLN
jgi:predicted SnoaL-like aldol condensation-catalyzing enzyme